MTFLICLVMKMNHKLQSPLYELLPDDLVMDTIRDFYSQYVLSDLMTQQQFLELLSITVSLDGYQKITYKQTAEE